MRRVNPNTIIIYTSDSVYYNMYMTHKLRSRIKPTFFGNYIKAELCNNMIVLSSGLEQGSASLSNHDEIAFSKEQIKTNLF